MVAVGTTKTNLDVDTVAEGTMSDCSVRNQSLDVRSTILLVRQYVGSHCTYAAMPETGTFDPKGDCYNTQKQK
jgi:hypothetical protein